MVTMNAVRVRHALRCALGGAILAMLSTTSLTSGCFSGVMYYISVIAGTPGYRHGFIIRSTIHTLYGSLLAVAIFLTIRLAFPTSILLTFFAELPVIALFATLRTEKSLGPLPLVTLAFSGLFLISNVFSTRSETLSTARTLAFDSLLAAGVALITQSICPDSCHAKAASIISRELDATGAALSAAASRILSVDCDSCDDCSSPATGASAENADWERIVPAGRRRVASYTALAKARQALDAAEYEPAQLGWRLIGRDEDEAEAWGMLLDGMDELVGKVACVESAANVVGEKGEGKPHFSKKNLVAILGKRELEEWVQFYAEAAAACHAAAGTVGLLGARNFGQVRETEACLDARSEAWAVRRKMMYEGFKRQYSLYWKRKVLLQASCVEVRKGCQGSSKSALEGDGVDGGRDCRHDLEHDSSDSEDVAALFEHEVMDDEVGGKKACVVRGSEIRSIIFVAVCSHMMSETLGRVQSAVGSCRVLRWRPKGVLRMFWLPAKPLAASLGSTFRLQLESWQSRFSITHTLMMSTILAVSIFVDDLKDFKTGEVAWVYASAGLSTQLSAESTLFIGILRATATVFGCATAFGVSQIVLATNSVGAQLVLGPYLFALNTAVLLLVPPKLRHASFLFILTNNFVTFCPRGSKDCLLSAASDLDPSCFPSWKFATVRGVNVVIGVVIAVGVHAILWPRSAQTAARRGLAAALNNATQIFAAIHRQYREVPSENDVQFCQEPAAPGANGDIPSSTSGSSDSPTYSSVHVTHCACEERILIEALYAEDGFEGATELSLLAKRHVWKPLGSALLLLSSDAALWDNSKLALPVVLKELPAHFATLAASLSELGSILARKPVLSGEYRGTAHTIFISPLFYEHETLIVSLFHVGSVVQKLLLVEKDSRTLASLQCAIRHLKMTLRVINGRIGELRRAIHSSTDDVSNSKRSETKIGIRRILSTGMLAGATADLQLPELSKERELSDFLHVDDMVLYNAFSFASNGCMAAFLSIADVCEDHVNCLLGDEDGPSTESKES